MKEIRLCDNGELGKTLNLCNQNSLGIEFQGFYDSSAINSLEHKNLLNECKEKLNDFKYGKSLHAPFFELNLGSKNPMIKEATMKTFNYAYKIAKELGCTEIVVHNGFIPNTSYYEGWVKSASLFWKEFFSDKDDSITMMVENQNEEDSELMKMEIDAVNDPRLKVCLDIGHAHANSYMKVEDWIKTLGNRIGYLHLHNNHGKQRTNRSYMNDEHLGLNSGTIDISNVLELLEEYSPDAIWNIETKTEFLEDSISYLQELGYIEKRHIK